MEKIKVIDRAALHAINLVALPALEIALRPFGVTVKPARSKYTNGSTGTLQVELIADGADPERENFERFAALYGVKPSDFGRLFTLNGVRYKLTGIEAGRPKFPFVGERTMTGGRFKFTRQSVIGAFEREPRDAA